MILTFICRLLKIGMRRLLLADSKGNCVIIRKWQVNSGTTYTKTPKEKTPSILEYKPKPVVLPPPPMTSMQKQLLKLKPTKIAVDIAKVA